VAGTAVVSLYFGGPSVSPRWPPVSLRYPFGIPPVALSTQLSPSWNHRTFTAVLPYSSFWRSASELWRVFSFHALGEANIGARDLRVYLVLRRLENEAAHIPRKASPACNTL
jgi:hypothetical protein